MVEFALLAPLFLILVFGMLVTGIVVMDQIQLNNAVRDGARAAAVCGSATPATATSPPTTSSTLPDGTPCAIDKLKSYLSALVNSVHGGVATPTFQVLDTTGTPVPPTNDLGACSGHAGSYQIWVHASYDQPLYLPLIGQFLGNGSTNTRTLTADAEATCEQ